MLRNALVGSSVALALSWAYIRHKQLPMGPTRLHWAGIVFGHRGCRRVPGIPENTLDAFKYAVSRGCKGVEFDIRLTKDDEVVIFHDAVSNGMLREVAKDRRIDSMTLVELKACSYVADPTQQIRVPTLEEAILFCRENNLRMLIEIKENDKLEVCVKKVVELYHRYASFMYEYATVISFNPSAVYNTRKYDKAIAVGQIYSRTIIRNWINSNAERMPWYVRACPCLCDTLLTFVASKIMPWMSGCSMICPRFSEFSESYRRRWLSRKIAVYLWGMPDSSHCTPEMHQPGVLVSADDKHEEFAAKPAPPNFDVFGDQQREQERQAEEQRKQAKLKPEKVS